MGLDWKRLGEEGVLSVAWKLEFMGVHGTGERELWLVWLTLSTKSMVDVTYFFFFFFFFRGGGGGGNGAGGKFMDIIY